MAEGPRRRSRTRRAHPRDLDRQGRCRNSLAGRWRSGRDPGGRGRHRRGRYRSGPHRSGWGGGRRPTRCCCRRGRARDSGLGHDGCAGSIVAAGRRRRWTGLHNHQRRAAPHPLHTCGTEGLPRKPEWISLRWPAPGTRVGSPSRTSWPISRMVAPPPPPQRRPLRRPHRVHLHLRPLPPHRSPLLRRPRPRLAPPRQRPPLRATSGIVSSGKSSIPCSRSARTTASRPWTRCVA